MIFTDKNITAGWLILLAGLLVLILMVVCFEHLRIWFSDTFNTDDAIEEFSKAFVSSSIAYQDGIFAYGNGSFTIQLERETKTIRWDNIVSIKAYKVDQYIVDCITVEIHLKDTFICINDQTAGHMKFMETASQQLPDFKKDWFMVVAFPAFATNTTIIYNKHDSEKA